MKEKLTRNMGVKILSVILAVILWLIITNIDDPVITKKFRNVDVKLVNQEKLDSLDKVYDIIENEKIDFTVAAKRSIIQNLDVSQMEVTADFTNMSPDFHKIIIDITCPRYGDEVTVVEGKYQRMSLMIDKLVEKNFKVNIMENGQVAEGYSIGNKIASPNIITVSGPKNKIEQIDELIVEPNVSGANGLFHSIEEPKLLDKAGNELDTSDYTFSESLVEATFELYKTKVIRLQIKTTGNPAKGYVATKVASEPQSIVITGKDEDLQKMNYELSITESIEGITESTERTIDIQEKLPEGIQLVQDDYNAVINITVEKLGTKEMTFKTKDIKVLGKPDNLDISYESADEFKVMVEGPESELINLMDNLEPIINVSNNKSGTYNKSVEFTLPKNMRLINKPVVRFKLALK